MKVDVNGNREHIVTQATPVRMIAAKLHLAIFARSTYRSARSGGRGCRELPISLAFHQYDQAAFVVRRLMRRSIRLPLAMAIGVACAGCAQTGRLTSSFPWSETPTPAATAKSKNDGEATKKAASEKDDDKDGDGEKQQTADAGKATVEKSPAKAHVVSDDSPASVKTAPVKTAEATPAEDSPAKVGETPKNNDGTVVHDAKTLALIDEELKLATPEERDKLFAEWKSLDAAMVQQVIRIRRMVRELESSSPASVATTPSTPTLPGTTSPWGVNANAASGPASAESKTDATAAIAVVEDDRVDTAQPTIEPASHNETGPTPGGQSTAAYGQSSLVAGTELAQLQAESGGPAANARPAGSPAGPPVPASAGDDSWNDQLRQMIAVAEARAEAARSNLPPPAPDADDRSADDPARRHYAESQVQLRLLYLMAGDQARAMQAIPDLDPADQQFWQQVLWGVSNYFDESAQPNRADRMTQTVDQLRTAVNRLQSEANLQLRNVAFCRKITSFGNFERFDRDEYSPGQRVLLYAEVVNFKSVPQSHDGIYRTQLTSTVEILRTGQSQPLTKIEFDPTIDLCRSYRQDYFHSYELKIPDELNVGDYVLKLTVEDNQSGKLATYTLNFTVK